MTMGRSVASQKFIEQGFAFCHAGNNRDLGRAYAIRLYEIPGFHVTSGFVEVGRNDDPVL